MKDIFIGLMSGTSVDKVDAVATANLFNFIGDGLPKARKMIIDQNGNIPNWI